MVEYCFFLFNFAVGLILMQNSLHDMKTRLLVYCMMWMAALSALWTGCSSGKALVTARQDADLLYYQKDYINAFDKYSSIIESYVSKKEAVPAELYALAGRCLYYSDSPSAAMPYFKLAEDAGFEDELTLMLQIKHYADADNLSKELDRLEKYSALYPDGGEINFVNYRLYLRYCEMQEYGKAIFGKTKCRFSCKSIL